MKKIVKMIDAETLYQWSLDKNRAENLVIIDIREPDEFSRERIAGTMNVPLSVFVEKDFSSEKGKIAVFHCHLGGRTRRAEPLFLQTPFKEVYSLEGGLEAWKRCYFPIEI